MATDAVDRALDAYDARPTPARRAALERTRTTQLAAADALLAACEHRAATDPGALAQFRQVRARIAAVLQSLRAAT